MPWADSHAEYMLGDVPRKSCLIHLPYWDGWDHPDASFIPKTEVIRRIKQKEKAEAYMRKVQQERRAGAT